MSCLPFSGPPLTPPSSSSLVWENGAGFVSFLTNAQSGLHIAVHDVLCNWRIPLRPLCGTITPASPSPIPARKRRNIACEQGEKRDAFAASSSAVYTLFFFASSSSAAGGLITAKERGEEREGEKAKIRKMGSHGDGGKMNGCN